ncbi:MAG TPA: YidC/Oxa1 family membrane protein insertase [Candidatus Acidoferrales bacterium]|nr:YidC/Oxa1 family membrane protein insertase [Candidatus Acidoferrales bacterium]
MPFLEPIWDGLLVHPLMALAVLAYGIAHDFGLAIVILTICIRLAVYPLYRTQIRSQRAMQELGPAMEELKKKYKDRQRFAEEQMKLYKEKGVNPAAGCVPLVLQLPLLFALYAAIVQLGCGLGHSIGASCVTSLTHDEAAQILFSWLPNPIPDGGVLDTAAHWLPWLNGLHERDPLYILPVVAGLAQLVASVMAMPVKQPANADPNTRMFQSMAYTFPLMTVVLGASFPAGLTVYWIATTTFQIVQQYFVSGWGQLPKYLPFLRNIPSPADRQMRKETRELIQEGRADLEKAEARGNGASEQDDESVDIVPGETRRRGRRRGKR